MVLFLMRLALHFLKMQGEYEHDFFCFTIPSASPSCTLL